MIGFTEPGRIYYEVKSALNPSKPAEGPVAAMAQASANQARKAYESAKQGEYLEATGHGMAAALPGIGPAAAQAGELIGGGEVARGLGQATGLLAPFGVGAVVPKVITKATKPLLGAPSEATLARQETGIPTMLGQYSDTGSWGRRMLERFLMNRALGREPMFNAIQEQNTAAQAAAGRVTGSLGPEVSPLETGTAVERILKSADEAGLKSLADAEQERVARINAEGEAAQRRGEVLQTDLRTRQAAAQAKATSDIQQTVSSLGDVNSPEVTGQAYHAAVRDNSNAFRMQARQLYSDLDNRIEQAGIVRSAISLQPIKDWMAKLAEDLGGVAGATASLKGVDVKALLETANRWKQAPMMASFADAQDVLSSLKSIGRDYTQLINSRYPGVVKKLTGMLEDEMQQKAAKVGALDVYREANGFYKEGVTLYNDSAAADLMNKNPEQVAATVWKPGAVTPLKEVQRSLAGQPEAWRALQRRGVEDLLERSMKDGVLDGSRLQAEWAKLGPDMQKTMVGEGNWKPFSDQIRQLKATQVPLEVEPVPKYKAQQPKPVRLELTPQQDAIRKAAASKAEELAGTLLQRGGESIGNEMRTALSGQPQLWNQVRRQAFQQMIDKASQPSIAGGSPILNARQLISDWRKLSPGAQSLIAGDQLPQVNRLMSAINGLDLNKLNTLHAAIYGGILDPTAGFVGATELGKAGINLLTLNFKRAALHGAGVVSAAIFMLAPRYVARMITNPAGIKWLTAGTDIPLGTEQAAKWMAQAPPLAGAATKPQEPKPLISPGLPAPPQ